MGCSVGVDGDEGKMGLVRVGVGGVGFAVSGALLADPVVGVGSGVGTSDGWGRYVANSARTRRSRPSAPP